MSRITFKGDTDQWKTLTKREIWEEIKRDFSKRLEKELPELKQMGMLDNDMRPRKILE